MAAEDDMATPPWPQDAGSADFNRLIVLTRQRVTQLERVGLRAPLRCPKGSARSSIRLKASTLTSPHGGCRQRKRASKPCNVLMRTE